MGRMMKMIWNQVVERFNLPAESSVVLSDNTDDHPWNMLAAGRILERLEIEMLDGKKFNNWIWLQFDNVADAVAFKLVWEE